MAFWAVVPAAGTGSRLNPDIPKQYLSLDGQTVLERSLARLDALAMISATVLVLRAGDNRADSLFEAGADTRARQMIRGEGGDDRCQSVLNGLYQLKSRAESSDWVLVHDAARPCVRVADMLRLLEVVAEHPVGGLLAVPVTDTLKQADDERRVHRTIDRRRLWAAQTPQVFRYGLLLEALQQATTRGYAVTDESSAMELAGHQPVIVQGSPDNIKITWPHDLALASLMLRSQDEM